MLLLIEPEAEAELEDAALRYERTVPGLGLEFLAEMRERTDRLVDVPQTTAGLLAIPPSDSIDASTHSHARPARGWPAEDSRSG